MKRVFVYLVLALMLSMLLCACGDTTYRGNVTASPWPDVTEPVLPTPSIPVSATPMPNFNTPNDTTGMNSDMETGTAGTGGMSTSSPMPTDTDQ